MTKKNVGIMVASYVALNLIVSYKAGVFHRMKELYDYERAHPNAQRKSMGGILGYAFGG